jgi:hypothetical protein
MHTQFKYGGYNVEVITTESGFYCRWPDGSTYITPTPEAAVFLAERLIDIPGIYGTPAVQ